MSQDPLQEPSNLDGESLQLVRTLDYKSEQKFALSSYVRVLERLNLAPTLHNPWAIIGKTTQVQGWKLHLSSIPSEADALLSRVIPLLCKYEVSFKIAQDVSVLRQLNEGMLGATQVGKFLTIYPQSDVKARQLAGELVEMTKGFHGPVIVTDLQLGDIVYARYGGFHPLISRDRLGQHFLSIYATDGSLRPDAYTVPFVPSEGVHNPFADLVFVTDQIQSIPQTAASQLPPKSPKLLGPGYLLLEVLQTHPKGSVFRGLDLRSQEQVSVKIIKQGRRYCLSDEYGRDIRTRLQRQEVLHQNLYGLVPIPKVDSYFEMKGDGYLPIEYIEGQSIESLVTGSLENRSWSRPSLTKQVRLLSYLEKILIAVEQLHATGYVHRDLTASNIWIGIDERVYLLDLELAHRIDDQSPAFDLGTPGFMSPDQEARKPPTFADDIYALGCIMILLLTGFDPNCILFAREKHRKDQLLGLTNSALAELIEIITQCLHLDPTIRPKLRTIKAAVQYSIVSLSSSGEVLPPPPIPFITCIKRTDMPVHDQMKSLIASGQQGLLEEVLTDRTSGLWLSPSPDSNLLLDRISVTKAPYEIRRSASRGVAGVIYLLSRLARFGYGTKATRDRVQPAIEWLLSENSAPDSQMPGLHFGEAGVAVAITEAISSGFIDRNDQIDAFLLKALSGQLDWPDITHGAAGQGIAVLYCADRLQDLTFLTFAHRCADHLISSQKNDGSWEMPPGVDGMSGQTLTGFAHGVSGIVYFLAEYAHRFGRTDAYEAWQAGANWMIEQAIPTDNGHALEWNYSTISDVQWKWWCHGSPGIALMLLRLYEQTKCVVYAEMASKALQVHPRDIRYPNLSQCHGLSGLGEIYLEAGRVLGNPQWYDRAGQIANTLFHLRNETDTGAASWRVEDPNFATADLMVGSSGVLHFLLRLSLSAEKIGFPLLLDPLGN